MKFPVEVTMEMADTEENRLAMAKCETITTERYKEPVDGKYKDATAVILAGLESELEADEELSDTSSESESEREGTDASDGENLLEIDVSRGD